MLRGIISKLLSSLLIFNVVGNAKHKTSMIKIKAARMYVLGVKKIRILLLGFLFISISLIFLINGLNLIQEALLTYSMWSNEVKFMAALLFGIFEFLGAIVILFFLFREETWVKFCGIQEIINSVVTSKDEKK